MLKKIAYSLYAVLCVFCLYQWGVSLRALFMLAFLSTVLYVFTVMFYTGENPLKFDFLQIAICFKWIVWGIGFFIWGYLNQHSLLLVGLIAFSLAFGGIFLVLLMVPESVYSYFVIKKRH
ncbi:hypothetical protein [Histophilus somni]|uniref:hypothetical protein n=1 Tax=Histophilus somni TaxID=731 RepID=UPI00201F047B|nr:hypothetical protein [Histophilus somni]